MSGSDIGHPEKIARQPTLTSVTRNPLKWRVWNNPRNTSNQAILILFIQSSLVSGGTTHLPLSIVAVQNLQAAKTLNSKRTLPSALTSTVRMSNASCVAVGIVVLVRVSWRRRIRFGRRRRASLWQSRLQWEWRGNREKRKKGGEQNLKGKNNQTAIRPKQTWRRQRVHGRRHRPPVCRLTMATRIASSPLHDQPLKEAKFVSLYSVLIDFLKAAPVKL